MTVTSAEIVNRAVQLIGGFNDQEPVTGTPPFFGGSPIGIAAGTLYYSVVQTVARQHGWDFSRNTIALVATGNTPPVQWDFEYAYPTNGIQVRQVMPAAIDRDNPLPINYTVGNADVTGTPTKVIWTNFDDAVAVLTNRPPEDLWDALFTESVVRLLASELNSAIPARPDSAREALVESNGFEKLGEDRND